MIIEHNFVQFVWWLYVHNLFPLISSTGLVITQKLRKSYCIVQNLKRTICYILHCKHGASGVHFSELKSAAVQSRYLCIIRFELHLAHCILICNLETSFQMWIRVLSTRRFHRVLSLARSLFYNNIVRYLTNKRDVTRSWQVISTKAKRRRDVSCEGQTLIFKISQSNDAFVCMNRGETIARNRVPWFKVLQNKENLFVVCFFDECRGLTLVDDSSKREKRI